MGPSRVHLHTFVTSIPALLLYEPALRDPVGYIAGGGHDKRILLGAVLELLLIVANIGTAVVIVPIMRRQHEELSIGYVTARLFECTFILVGIVLPHRPRTAGVDVARARRRTADHHLRDDRALRRQPADSALKGPAAIPEALWELFLGVYCTIWGFKSDVSILADDGDGVVPIIPCSSQNRSGARLAAYAGTAEL